ncbi:hypothetical protein LK533_12750 [Sphingomonas sp. PL-96]|uniref:hypothetical protein n=1 Tax=Sphingomonas sp. PL-96 TaxID=2887201 RepID=UPI001E5826ED|nr:hypothetical protein [Sphingomonas sp. PL-96]MCC2977540.1 hypothetical protein [Sphingomonas sp. PL-96]
MTRQTGLRRDPIAWALFVLVWFSCGWFGSWEFNPNNATRMYAAVSLVEQGDATIDEYAALTIDRAQFGDHFYTDKAPGMTLMAVPFVALADAVTGDNAEFHRIRNEDPGFNRFIKIRVRLTAVFTSALFVAIAAMLLFDLGRGITGSSEAGLFGAAGYALGSIAWGWATTIFGHAASGAMLVIAVWAVWRGTRTPGGTRASIGYAAIAGLALGWGAVIEPPLVLEALPIGLWALWRMRGWAWAQRLPVMLAAAGVALVAVLPLFAYNAFAFGSPFQSGYSGVTDFAGMQQGFFGLTYPKPHVLWEIVFGPRRGILWVSPVLVLAPIGLAWLYGDRRHRDLAVLAITLSILPFLYNAAYYYWDGGHSTGPRHAVPALGFLAIGLASFWSLLRTPVGKLLAAQLLAISIAINLMIASAEIAAPDFFEYAVWRSVLLERFAPGYLRTVADEWLGFTPWEGLGIWALVALPLLGFVAWLAWRADGGSVALSRQKAVRPE